MPNLSQNALRVREARRSAFDALKDNDGRKRPGSLNPRKGGAPHGKRPKRR